MATPTGAADLIIRDLHATVADKEILRGVNLEIRKGETHALMGPNGSGKSTLANVIMGHPAYTVTGGEIIFKGHNVADLTADKRARMGLFLAFQYPLSVPGVTLSNFLRSAYAARKEGFDPDKPVEASGTTPKKRNLNPTEFRKLLQSKMEILKVDNTFLSRYLNEGFSGGEKKRAEILQMAILAPEIAVLDETDSGLDIDALRIVAEGVNALRGPQMGSLIITHYQRLLNYITPDIVHVMYKGQIIRTGGRELALELEEKGYAWLTGEEAEEAVATA
ncbi:MAG: Fe-S cluster assembly ATPase SufC [Ktedonobacterales bacterium]|nr:Fe-S cluster assembly ATPase SufC [Ktedonobacterales bacterium]